MPKLRSIIRTSVVPAKWVCDVTARTSFKTLFPMDLVLSYKAFSKGNGGLETGSSAFETSGPPYMQYLG